MEVEKLRALLEHVQSGDTSVDDALQSLRSLPFEDIGFAKLDHHRTLRSGFPEVIYCPNKRTEHIVEIAQRLRTRAHKVLATRANAEVAQAVQAAMPETLYHEAARILVIPGTEPILAEPPKTRGTVLVVAAGTADFAVAEEAAITAQELGSPIERLYDVGVAGLHRLLSHQTRLYEANVLIVVAGMEGALPSVVGGLVSRPVIAVPTSVGYGANFHGLSALLTMLNSCASGIGVVNIDNGFGAGYLAHLINQE